VYEKIRDEAEPLQDPHLVLWSDGTTLENMIESILGYANITSISNRSVNNNGTK
jgi:hypothetical protein